MKPFTLLTRALTFFSQITSLIKTENVSSAISPSTDTTQIKANPNKFPVTCVGGVHEEDHIVAPHIEKQEIATMRECDVLFIEGHSTPVYEQLQSTPVGTVIPMEDPALHRAQSRVFAAGYPLDMDYASGKISKDTYCQLSSDLSSRFQKLSEMRSVRMAEQIRGVVDGLPLSKNSKNCEQVRRNGYYDDGTPVQTVAIAGEIHTLHLSHFGICNRVVSERYGNFPSSEAYLNEAEDVPFRFDDGEC